MVKEHSYSVRGNPLLPPQPLLHQSWSTGWSEKQLMDPLSYISLLNRKDVFYLGTHSTHFIYGYFIYDIKVKT